MTTMTTMMAMTTFKLWKPSTNCCCRTKHRRQRIKNRSYGQRKQRSSGWKYQSGNLRRRGKHRSSKHRNSGQWQHGCHWLCNRQGSSHAWSRAKENKQGARINQWWGGITPKHNYRYHQTGLQPTQGGKWKSWAWLLASLQVSLDSVFPHCANTTVDEIRPKQV